MPSVAAKTKSIYLIGGADEFSIKETAAKLAEKLAPKKAGEFGLEIIDGSASNQDEALKVLSRVHEALNTVGLFGGGDGTLNSIELTYPDGHKVAPRNKDLITGVPKGTIYRQLAGGGGGWGDPKKRDRSVLAREIRDGIISPEAARDAYGWES